MRCLLLAAFLVASLCLPNGSNAQESPAIVVAKQSGFVDVSIYKDSRGYGVLTINTLATLQNYLEYFALADLAGTSASGKPYEAEVFYSEQNLRWPVDKGRIFSLAAQWAGQSGPDNDLLRLGLLVRLSETRFVGEFLDGSKNSLSINVFPVQFDHTDNQDWQVEYFYRFQILPSALDDRVYLSGFADQNIDSETRSFWVTEHQLGVMLLSSIYAVVEYRFNDFLPTDKTGTALGFEFLLDW